MATRPGQIPPVSPFVYVARDSQGLTLSISFPYDNTTGLLNGPATVHRDDPCAYTKILVDKGGDGKPDSSAKKFNVPNLNGDRTFNLASIQAQGLNTRADIAGTQITAQ